MATPLDFMIEAGRPIAFYPQWSKALGGTTACLLFCQLMYWTDKGHREDGWLYKSAQDIEAETGLSYEEQKTARKKLVDRGVIYERYRRLDHQMDFLVDREKAFSLLSRSSQCHSPEQGNATFGNKALRSSFITENTTETTDIEYCASGDARQGEDLSGIGVGVEIFQESKVRLMGLVRQKQWFEAWWSIYWRKDDKAPAWKAFKKHIQTVSRFEEMLVAFHRANAEMLSRAKEHRPLGATWLNKEPWSDTGEPSPPQTALTTTKQNGSNTARLSRSEQSMVDFNKRLAYEHKEGLL